MACASSGWNNHLWLSQILRDIQRTSNKDQAQSPRRKAAKNDTDVLSLAMQSTLQSNAKVESERKWLATLITKAAEELEDRHFDFVLATVEEAHHKRSWLESTLNRENESVNLLKELRNDLVNERKITEEEVLDRNQVIQQLKDTIQEINVLTASEQKYVRKETKAHEAGTRVRCAAKENSLQESKAELLLSIEQEQTAHQRIVDYLSYRRRLLDDDIQAWMSKYEQDMESKSQQIDALKQQRSADLDKFEELVTLYEELLQLVEDDKKTEDETNHQANGTINRAAIQIQRQTTDTLD
ncbi:hypothetical protein M427DRAFT_28841 [Gonapodya prolifera JEL478]|uniref:Uncharacterized protein n=1 Tax=Gonapodya prolifera (strain JEL478) TaxID=1344416 RepID=A0A139ARM9_GONPJ|nr:hypothetical protein M427DRAFT_28841 [Gonapodya prolifera JEL478]|eukprot:KXS19359.1 hypothetical protein M427DRAFT_28841 [Gonapodya prolifera JEL478]